MMNIRTYDDHELIELIINGGSDLEIAFTQLLKHEKRFRSIRKLIVGMGAPQEDYEEILDDTLVALYSSVKGGRFEERSTIYSYMHGIAKNMWLKRCSKKKMHLVQISYDLDYQEPSIETNIIASERRKILVGYIMRLGENCRKILVKSFIEGLKNSELVKIMNYKNDAVVRKTKSKCLKKLVSSFKANPELLNQLR